MYDGSAADCGRGRRGAQRVEVRTIQSQSFELAHDSGLALGDPRVWLVCLVAERAAEGIFDELPVVAIDSWHEDFGLQNTNSLAKEKCKVDLAGPLFRVGSILVELCSDGLILFNCVVGPGQADIRSPHHVGGFTGRKVSRL